MEYLYKISNNIIIKEEIVAKNWCNYTTKDKVGNYYAYNIKTIDHNEEIFSHIILAYQYLKGVC